MLPILFLGCSQENQSGDKLSFTKQGREVPEFNADSAYHFIEQQVDAGPRNPGSVGHKKIRSYLLNKLKQYASDRTVYPQDFTADGYGNDSLQLTNIIASFNPKSSDRIMLSAHWDTRPYANQDSVRVGEPILGADDGGSGVGVLLELARLFKQNSPPIGIDIVLFDGEDYGKDGELEKFFLGSRHWSKNPPVKGYSPRFGILLDMVGGKDAQFPREKYSMQYAPSLVNEIWSIAESTGQKDTFIDKEGSHITDDHYIINKNLSLPTIDIVNYQVGQSGAEFPDYWHTHQDRMDIISKKTLNSVGNVLTELVYNRIETDQ